MKSLYFFISRVPYRFILRNMSSVMVQKLNVITGKNEWQIEDENYDFHQEIARSAFADMLHDSDRNQKYYSALRIAIKHKHEAGEKANVLDIGTGTGLLSMMAATCGADSIVACECFSPIASVAKEVIEKNGFKNRIKIIGKRSTDLVLGQDMERRANILVAEVFDTELIGEGAIETFNHAKKHLLEPGAIVIPSFGLMWAAIVESEELSHHSRLPQCIRLSNGDGLTVPDYVRKCQGTASLHDIQVSQLPENSFRVLTDPVIIFQFDFGSGNLEKYKESRQRARVTKAGRADCLVMWWELLMLPPDLCSSDVDWTGDINQNASAGGRKMRTNKENVPVISCAPSWAESPGEWRDHWMQAVYYFQDQDALGLKIGEEAIVKSFHDEYSLWFHLQLFEKDSMGDEISAPVCSCGLHVTSSRSRLASMNNESLRNRYVEILSKIIRPSTVIMFIGDCSFLPLIAAKLGAEQVYCVEENNVALRTMKSLIDQNRLGNKITLLPEYQCSFFRNEVDVLFAEPYFRASLLPWDSLRYWYLIRNNFPNVKRIYPFSASVYALPIDFENLYKIRAPLGVVEGFDMTPFDLLIKNSSDISDSNVEPHPLWEYPGIALSRPEKLITLNFKDSVPDRSTSSTGTIKIESEGSCSGMALWMEWEFSGRDAAISCGPTKPVVCGEKVHWDVYTKQGVYFFPRPPVSADEISYNVTFDPKEATCSFHFDAS